MAMALNPEAMRDLFEERVFREEGACRVEKCELLQSRYKPGVSCLFSYALTVRNPRTETVTQRLFSVRAYESGTSYSRYCKALTQPLVEVAGTEAITHLPEQEMVVWAFPNDRKLRGLPALATPDEGIGIAVQAAFGPAWKIDRASSELVHYVAEHTCTLRVRLRLLHRESRQERQATLYGKTYYNDEGAEAFENMMRLWNGAARRAGRLRLAQPVCYQPEARILWQLGIDGAPLIDYEGEANAFPALLEKAAQCVAELHRMALPALRSHTRADRIERIRDSVQRIACAAPGLAERSRQIARALIAGAPMEGATAGNATLHGDLHLKNFLVDGEEVALIDLDNLHQGDPMAEVGSFIAGLYYRALITGRPMAAAEALADHFTRAYRRHWGADFSMAALAWEIAASLVSERAARCITRLKPGGLEALPSLLDLADQLARRGVARAEKSFAPAGDLRR